VSLIRLYIDEDSQSHAFVRALRSRNVDVTTALESAMIERDDEAHLLFATSQGRVLYSFNVGTFTDCTHFFSPSGGRMLGSSWRKIIITL
jgi:hypothetical protein